VLLVGGVWDAINDPIIGVWSDRVHTRWGRRRPFFLIGAIPYAILFVLLFLVPPIPSQLGKCIYYSLVYIAFDTVFTFVSVPYNALTPELTEDYDERTHFEWLPHVRQHGRGSDRCSRPPIDCRFIREQSSRLPDCCYYLWGAGCHPLFVVVHFHEGKTPG